ncbi:MAG: E3 binding domain-containing protein [Acidimicrobiia bacterium]
MAVVRRRSRRRRSSYSDEDDTSAAEVRTEDLSPRAQRLVESGVIDLATVAGSGEDGRITSGDILERARLMEKEQSLARIEAIGPNFAEDRVPEVLEPSAPDEYVEPETTMPSFGAMPTRIPGAAADFSAAPGLPEVFDADADADAETGPVPSEPMVSEPTWDTSTSAAAIGGEPIEVTPSPWDAYNGSSQGLAEIALPGADQSWGEAEANIAAIAEEAAAQLYGRPVDPEPVLYAAEPETEPTPTIETTVPEVFAAPPEPAPSPQPSRWMPQVEAAPEASAQPEDDEIDKPSPEPGLAEQEPEQHAEVLMDFGTLEQVDPASVWAEGAEYFAPWFLAHSKQLGDVLGLAAGLKDARQYTTKSASGVVGRDDNGDDVVVVSSEEAVANDSDLGRALGMAASSGAATVALVSAKFEQEQLQALSWLNSQTKSGVKWFGIEMKVVRIADSPAAMLFELVASPPS